MPGRSAHAGVVFGHACELHIFKHDLGAMSFVATNRPSDCGSASDPSERGVRHRDAFQSTTGSRALVLAVLIELDGLAHSIKDDILVDYPLDCSCVGRETFDVRRVASAGEGHISERHISNIRARFARAVPYDSSSATAMPTSTPAACDALDKHVARVLSHWNTVITIVDG
jgi:hypothetical protein